MNKPFSKPAAPISYAEGPRLSRALQTLPYSEQERFLKFYQAHLASPRIQSLQRRGHTIYFAVEGSDTPEVFDFGQEHNAQRVLSALTDCLRANRAAVKVLMPASLPPQS